MQPYEVDAMKMMIRKYNMSIFTYEECFREYLIHLRFWNHIIESHNINAYISSIIPHLFFDYIIYALCKAKGISVNILDDVRINGLVYVFNDLDKIGTDTKREYRRLLDSKAENFDEIKLHPIIQEYWTKQNSAEPEPFFMKGVTKKVLLSWNHTNTSFWVTFKSMLKLLIKYDFERLYESVIIVLKILIRKLQLIDVGKKYDEYAVIPNFNTKFIYYALHYQPEATTLPLAGYYDEQILSLQMLSYCLKGTDVVIYIKEHPHQLYRENILYKDIMKLSNVKLVKRDVSTYDLLNKSIAVASATGTVLWEALFRSKPSIIFGNTLIEFAPGAFKIENVEDCKKAIDCIVNNKWAYDEKKLKIFLKALENTSFRGFAYPLPYDVVKLTYEENTKNIVEELDKRLKGV